MAYKLMAEFERVGVIDVYVAAVADCKHGTHFIIRNGEASFECFIENESKFIFNGVEYFKSLLETDSDLS